MKLVLAVIFILLAGSSNCQDLPSDSLILKTIFGKVEKVKGDFMFVRSFKEGEDYNSYPNDIRYSVVFKERVHLKGQDIIFIVAGAPLFTLMGDHFEYRQMFFYKTDLLGQLKLIKSIVSKEEVLVGERTEYQVVQIGKNAWGLMDTFHSTGNKHYEQIKGISLLQIGKITGLLSVDTGYDNSAFISEVRDNEECQANCFESTFTIEKSEKEFYDVKVHRTDYKYTKGCKEKLIDKESDSIFIYEKGKYVEHKK